MKTIRGTTEKANAFTVLKRLAMPVALGMGIALLPSCATRTGVLTNIIREHVNDVQIGDTIHVVRGYSDDSPCGTEFVITAAAPTDEFVFYNGKTERVMKTFNTTYNYAPTYISTGGSCVTVKDQFVSTLNGDVILVKETVQKSK